MPNPPLIFDPRSPEFRADPYPTYEALRPYGPLALSASGQSWIVTGYSLIKALLLNPHIGHPEPQFSQLGLAEAFQNSSTEEKLARLLTSSDQMIRLWMLFRNPPDHGRLRRVLDRYFAPPAMKRLRPWLYAATQKQLAFMDQTGHFDLLTDFAKPLALKASAQALGLPTEDETLLKWLGQALTDGFDRLGPTRAELMRMFMGRAQLTEFFRQEIEKRLRAPRNDALTAAAQAYARGRQSLEEAVANVTQIVEAGYLATPLLVVNGVRALLHHPEQLAWLQAHPGQIGSALEELLRFDSPTHFTPRTVRADVPLGKHTLRAGQNIFLLRGAANREPGCFAAPDQLNLQRRNFQHLAFGWGIHYCLGAPLSRVVGEVTLSLLLPRLAHWPVEAAPARGQVFVIHGVRELPVKLEPRE